VSWGALAEGSVRRLGSQVRVNAQLVDAETDAHLWAERFDRDTGDLFALQDEITSRIANALNIELIAAEAARPTEHPDALDYILRGRAAKLKPDSRDSFAEAIRLFEHALALDPESVEAQTHLAASLAGLRVFYGTSDLVAAELARADVLIDRALAVAPRYALAHYVKGQVLRAQNRSEEAITQYETALASNPNLAVALNGLGWCKLFAGSIDEVIPLMEQAIRCSPRDPQIGVWHGAIGMVHLLQSRIDEAIVWLEKARSASPDKPYNHLHLAAACALSGDLDRAALELAAARRLDAGTLYSSIAHLKAFPGAWWGVPKIRDLYEATYFAGLRKLGVPEAVVSGDSRGRCAGGRSRAMNATSCSQGRYLSRGVEGRPVFRSNLERTDESRAQRRRPELRLRCSARRAGSARKQWPSGTGRDNHPGRIRLPS
jgi:tetratricopeptide (TPR) repeat protein